MRVVSWNVRSLRDGRRAVASALASLAPDVVILQEAPRLWLWRSSRRRLARRAGLRVATGGRAAGNVILVRARPERAYARSFPRRRGLHRRGTVGVVVLLDGRQLAIVGTHLDLDPAARQDSAAAVRALAPSLPLVLGADVNEEPGGPAWRLLLDGLVDLGTAPTFPARAPQRRIDVLAAAPELSVALRVVPTAASDHQLLVADVRWNAPTGCS